MKELFLQMDAGRISEEQIKKLAEILQLRKGGDVFKCVFQAFLDKPVEFIGDGKVRIKSFKVQAFGNEGMIISHQTFTEDESIRECWPYLQRDPSYVDDGQTCVVTLNAPDAELGQEEMRAYVIQELAIRGLEPACFRQELAFLATNPDYKGHPLIAVGKNYYKKFPVMDIMIKTLLSTDTINKSTFPFCDFLAVPLFK